MKIPDEIRLQIVMGWQSPALKALIDEAIADEDAEVMLRAVVGPDLEDAAMERAAELAREWVPLTQWIDEKRGPSRAKRLLAEQVMRGEWPPSHHG